MNNAPLVVAYGGGVNSTAMLIGMYEQSIRPDLILMADTGGEKDATKRWLSTFAAWLRDHDMPSLVVVQNIGMYRTLEANCLEKAMLPSLAYGFKSCSDKYKRRPQDQFVSQWPPAVDAWAAGGKVRKAIGYDADEQRRAGIPGDAKYRYWYPLIEWGWGRDECVAACVRAGLPTPPKSACFFCPAMKKAEVLALKRDEPHHFQRAVEMERKARDSGNLSTVKGLGRSWSWESLGAADDAQATFDGFIDPDDEPCGCFDGDYDGIDDTVIQLSISAGCKAAIAEEIERGEAER